MRHVLWSVPLLLLLLLFPASCGQQLGQKEEACVQADTLNAQSYRWRYASLDSAQCYATRAMEVARRAGYTDGKTEAQCHLAFVDLMRMDYARARARLDSVREESRNELLKLMADVQLMRVCQRRGLNYDFYSYMESARMRIKRLESQTFSAHQQMLWNYCRTDFSLTLSTYFYYLRQEQEVAAEFDLLRAHAEWFEADTAQLALYSFLVGNQRRVGEGLQGDELDELMHSLSLSLRHGYIYVGGKCMASIAEDLLLKQHPRASQLVFLRELLQVPDTVQGAALSLAVCDTALTALSRYGSLFDESQTHLALASCLWQLQQPERALDETLLALDGINLHHRQATCGRDTVGLQPFETITDSVCRELLWIRDPQAQAVPDWMADVREFLSIAYSDLGRKYESDYNRNVYLDLLDATRQDRRMEQRIDEIAGEERRLDRAIVLSVVALAVSLVLLIVGVRRLQRNYEEKSRREKSEVEHEMAEWLAKSDSDFAKLEQQRVEAEEENAAKEMQLDEQKCRYIDKATSLSIVRAITPFLDRALHESDKLDTSSEESQDSQSRLRYIAELAEHISLLNDILTRWIKVRQGAVSLHVETFPLQALLDIEAKSAPLFQQADITFEVNASPLTVKADRTLTLFMINTLLDNARKFTPTGGRVSLDVAAGEGYAEVSVTDTGLGLSEQDVATLNAQRVYDSTRIGTTDGEAASHKGSGFGLMNCKGIIDKYRKTNPRLFGVCLFGVESQRGKGSRFFFRLPLAARVLLLSLALFLGGGSMSLTAQPFRTITDSLPSDAPSLPDDARLRRAAAYVDSVYFANVAGHHDRALLFVDSACQSLNAYYIARTGDTRCLMRTCAPDSMSEIGWWYRHVPVDYHLIIDLRNEAAIAALALRDRETYGYNNEIYTRLYKLMAQDNSLADYVTSLRQTAQGRRTAFGFIAVLLVGALLVFASYYYRHHILTTFNLRQVLEFSHRIFEQTDTSRLPNLLAEGFNQLQPTDGVALVLSDGTAQYSSPCPHLHAFQHAVSQLGATTPDAVTTAMGGRLRVYPLVTTSGQHVGVMAVLMRSAALRDDYDRLFRLIARDVATTTYYGAVRMERMRDTITLTADLQRRTAAEASALHVQNQVIDNTLSAIKHETMYYPSRILQLTARLMAAPQTANGAEDLRALLAYYKEVFSLLTECAAAQLRHSPLRRTTLHTASLSDYARQSYARLSRLRGCEGPLSVAHDSANASIVGDVSMLRYLIDNLLSFVLDVSDAAPISLHFTSKGNTVEMSVATAGASFSAEEFHNLFYPEALRYDSATDTLRGSQLLLARQIVREHDDHVRRGLRIYAEPLQADGTGMRIVCTLPQGGKQE